MTNYSNNTGSVRVEFFKPSGKWYMTEAWDMSNYYNTGITPIEAVEIMLNETERGRSLHRQFIISVADPYHKLAYPVLLVPEVMWRAKYESDAEARD